MIPPDTFTIKYNHRMDKNYYQKKNIQTFILKKKYITLVNE